MKKATLLVITALFALAGTVQAQQKIGHINSSDILVAMPEFKTMQDDLQKQKDTYTKVLQTMYEDHDKKQKDLQGMVNDKTTPDAVVDMKVKELQDLQQRISDFEEKVNNDLQKMQQEKMKPINEKYLKAVKDVAMANGYSYILDVVSGALAYFPEGTNDVTDLVFKKMGITPAPAGTNTTNTPVPPKTGNN